MSTQYIVEGSDKMAVNTQLLEDRIKESGLKKSYLASKLGISVQNLKLKCDNKSDFRLSEANMLCQELNITKLSDKEKIFYNL